MGVDLGRIRNQKGKEQTLKKEKKDGMKKKRWHEIRCKNISFLMWLL